MNIPKVSKILETAECKEVSGLKCFIVSIDQFAEITGELGDRIFETQVLTREGYENCELRLSSLEESTYYLCAKSQPILDGLWKKKHKA